MLRCGSMNLNDLIYSTDAQIHCLSQRIDFPKDRKGGYLCIAEKSGGLPLLITAIGDFPAEKAKRYFEFAQEKAIRLAIYIPRRGHASSWQSRNETMERYGGAIVAGGFIFSFSGLPEWGDEAAMLGVARGCGLLTKEEALAIAQISKNPFLLSA